MEYFIDRGVLGVTKDLQHPVLEYTGEPVAAGTRWKFDSSQSLVVPVMPPTLIDVCRLLQIYYVLKVMGYSQSPGEKLWIIKHSIILHPSFHCVCVVVGGYDHSFPVSCP